jgi:hypothetical protein
MKNKEILEMYSEIENKINEEVEKRINEDKSLSGIIIRLEKLEKKLGLSYSYPNFYDDPDTGEKGINDGGYSVPCWNKGELQKNENSFNYLIKQIEILSNVLKIEWEKKFTKENFITPGVTYIDNNK